MKKITVEFVRRQSVFVKSYHYLCRFDEVKVGDVVVLDTPYGYHCGHVTEVCGDTTSQSRLLKQVVQIVDVDSYTALLGELTKLQNLSKKIDKELARQMKQKKPGEISAEFPTVGALIAEQEALSKKLGYE